MGKPGVERKLATILSADVEGYARLMRGDDEGTLRTLKSHCDLFDVLISEYRGRVFGRAGDSLIAEFASPVQAMRCAIDVQDELAKRNVELAEDRRMRFRIGVNLGDVIVEDDNLFGDGVNVAARLESLAEPGGVCVSGTVFDQVRHHVERDFVDIGEQRLKNIPDPVRVYRVGPAGIDAADAPVSSTARDGRTAVAHLAWNEAFSHLSAADKTAALDAEDLELLAESAWWTGRIDDCINADERAYALYMKQGNARRAALVCMKLAVHYFHRLAGSIAAGWFARAEQLLEAEPESVEHGYLIRIKGRIACEVEGNLDRALELAKLACEMGTRFDNRNLRALALHDQGCILVAKGRVGEGMALMQEVMAAALGNELDAMTTGRVFCNVIDICEKLADYKRAGEWDEAAKRWCVRTSHESGFPGICRVKRAGIMRARGKWAEAEQEARCAAAELEDFLDFAAVAFYEIGEIRLGTGDLAAAEEAFRRAHELGRDPQPGLARLKLAEGNLAGARAFIQRALGKEGQSPLDRARLLPTHIELELADGDRGLARAAIAELQSIAATYGSPALAAAAAYARASLEFEEGQLGEAAVNLERSCKLWRESGLPYDEARTRVLLGLVYRAQGAGDLADLEFDTARATFQRLGAVLELQRLARLGEAGTK